VSATHDLLSAYQHVIEEVSLLTGSKGVFDVTVDGEVLYSKHETGRHAEPGEVLALFERRLGPDVRRYGT
jgi:predicted Rdx family selenoprotein